MSEHSNGPGTDELDTAFSDLVDDVATRNRRPGADQAVRTAGRRRAASATVAVVAVLALVGFGGWAVQNHASNGAPVVGVPSGSLTPSPSAPSDDVPTPALMSLRSLNAASAGWVRWEDGTGDTKAGYSCPATADAGSDPQDVTTQQYRSAADGSVLLRQFRFTSTRDSDLAMRSTVEAVLACPASTGSFYHDVSADLEVVGTTWTSGSRRGAVWLVNHGNRMDVLQVVGPTGPPERVREALTNLIAADVQIP